MPKSSSKLLFKLDFSFIVPSSVVLGAQIWNIKLRSSKLIIKSTTQKVIPKLGSGHRFHDLKYFEIGYFFVFLGSHLNLRAPPQKFVEKNVNLM